MSKISINKTANILADQQGFESFTDFLKSVFHIKQTPMILKVTTATTTFATLTEQYLGVKLIVLIGIAFLFFIEMGTGFYYAWGKGELSSTRLPRGLVKMAVYVCLMGCVHIFATHLPVPEAAGYKFNIYVVIYYAFLNLIILNLLLSVIENFEKLGWDEYIPVIRKIHSFLKLKKTQNDTNKESEL